MSNNVETKIIELISLELNIDPSKIKPESDFVKDLNADSIDTANIINAVDIHFKIKIDMKEAASIETVSALVDFVKTKQRIKH